MLPLQRLHLVPAPEGEELQYDHIPVVVLIQNWVEAIYAVFFGVQPHRPGFRFPNLSPSPW